MAPPPPPPPPLHTSIGGVNRTSSRCSHEMLAFCLALACSIVVRALAAVTQANSDEQQILAACPPCMRQDPSNISLTTQNGVAFANDYCSWTESTLYLSLQKMLTDDDNCEFNFKGCGADQIMHRIVDYRGGEVHELDSSMFDGKSVTLRHFSTLSTHALDQRLYATSSVALKLVYFSRLHMTQLIYPVPFNYIWLSHGTLTVDTPIRALQNCPTDCITIFLEDVDIKFLNQAPDHHQFQVNSMGGCFEFVSGAHARFKGLDASKTPLAIIEQFSPIEELGRLTKTVQQHLPIHDLISQCITERWSLSMMNAKRSEFNLRDVWPFVVFPLAFWTISSFAWKVVLSKLSDRLFDKVGISGGDRTTSTAQSMDSWPIPSLPSNTSTTNISDVLNPTSTRFPSPLWFVLMWLLLLVVVHLLVRFFAEPRKKPRRGSESVQSNSAKWSLDSATPLPPK